jgi:hypothetical protein
VNVGLEAYFFGFIDLSTKMKVNTLEGIKAYLEQYSRAYQLKKSEIYKYKYLDKVHWFLNSIIVSNYFKYKTDTQKYRFVPLSSTTLKARLGKDKPNILRDLAPFIDIDHSYIPADSKSSDGYSMNDNKLELGLSVVRCKTKGYKLNKRALDELGIGKAVICDKDLIRNIELRKELQRKHYSKHKVTKQALYYIYGLKVDKKELKAIHEKELRLATSEIKKEHLKNCTDILLDLNSKTTSKDNWNSRGFYFSRSSELSGGRLYNTYNSMPKAFRKALRYEGKKLYEIDMKSCAHSLLALNFINLLSSSSREKESKLLDIVLSGNFYEALAESCKEVGKESYYKLFLEDRALFKTKFMKFIFGRIQTKYKPTFQKALELMSPKFAKYILDYKSNEGYKAISVKAFNLESSLFIDNLLHKLDNKDFALTIHDAVLTTKDRIEGVKSILKDNIVGMFPNLNLDSYNLNKLFRYE